MYYLAEVLETIKLIACIISCLSGFAFCISLVWMAGCMSDDSVSNKHRNSKNDEYIASKVFFKISIIILIVSLLLVIFIPSKEIFITM